MILQSLSLQNFRNFKKRTFSFSKETTVIVGPNTSGKTNILEAIYVLATGKSFRADQEREMIKKGEEITRLKAKLLTGALSQDKTELEICITTGQIHGQKVPRKKYLINGVSKKMSAFLTNFYAVLFNPENLALVTNSPSLRRKYLDLVLAQVDWEYRRNLISYEKALRQRNKILEKIREEGILRSQLLFWNQLLIKNGQYLTSKRQEFIDFVNKYSPNQPVASKLPDFQLKYDQSLISLQRLEQYAEEEVAAGATLVGPHRDDIKFNIKNETLRSLLGKAPLERKNDQGRDLSSYGSRGEQRLAILWLKLAEASFVEEKTGQKPVLLLDDIFSELDEKNKSLIKDLIINYQTIITATEMPPLFEKAFIISLL